MDHHRRGALAELTRRAAAPYSWGVDIQHAPKADEPHAPADRHHPRPGGAPADGLVDVAPMVALAVLVLNDHVAKAAWPGFVTGKLSDVAGLFLAPLVVQAGWELVRWATGRWTGPSMRALVVAIVVVGFGFAAVKAWAPATDLFRWGLGAAQWPFAAVAALLGGSPAPPLGPVRAATDAADLLALLALALTWWTGHRRVRARAALATPASAARGTP